jgi:ectoine hydroxylase-related dioxygenase (phytanoyl-CoA dioxygenase family)
VDDSAVRAHFERHGFVVVPGVFDAKSVSGVREAVDVACERFRRGEDVVRSTGLSLSSYIEKFPDRSPGVSPVGLGDEPYILGTVAAIGGRVKGLLDRDEMWQLAATLLRVDGSRVVYHYAQIVRNPARVGPALGWHRDFQNEYVSTEGAEFVRLLVPLSSMSRSNGGTGVVSGSHLVSDEAVPPDPSTLRRRTQYPSCVPGDVLALHPKVLHTRAKNRSDRDRDVLAAQFGCRDADMRHVAQDEYLSLATQDQFKRASDPCEVSRLQGRALRSRVTSVSGQGSGERPTTIHNPHRG